jgi:hypothetical protein
MAKDRRTLAEEMPEAYKNVADVVDVMHRAGFVRRVAEIRPVASSRDRGKLPFNAFAGWGIMARRAIAPPTPDLSLHPHHFSNRRKRSNRR